MSIEDLTAAAEIRTVLDQFAILADEKRNHEQMALFAPDATLQVYIGGERVVDLTGVDQIEATFTAFSASTERSHHMNGQQVVTIDGDTATGVAYCQVKAVTRDGDHEVLADSSIRYDDEYARLDGRWVIRSRITRFVTSENRPLAG